MRLVRNSRGARFSVTSTGVVEMLAGKLVHDMPSRHMVAPVPPRLKEWAYAGFFINIVSALIAHFSLGDGPEKWSFAAGTFVLWALSYFLWRRLGATPRMSS